MTAPLPTPAQPPAPAAPPTTPAPPAPPVVNPAAPAASAPADPPVAVLGDAGQQAIDRMKAERNDARNAYRPWKDFAKELGVETPDELRARLTATAPTPPEGQSAAPDVEQIRRDAKRDADQKANERIVRAELKVAAAGKLADPADAMAFIDVSKFHLDDDGNPDLEELQSAIDALLVKKPHLKAAAGAPPRVSGSADAGVRAAETKTLDQQITEAQAKGDYRSVISLQNQKFEATQT